MAPVETVTQLIAREAATVGFNLLVPRKGGGGKGGGGAKGSGSKGSGSSSSSSKGSKKKSKGGVVFVGGGVGTIVGIVIGVIVLIILLLVIWYFWRKHRANKRAKEASAKVAEKEAALEEGEDTGLVAGQEGQHQAAHLSNVPYQGGAAASYYAAAPGMTAEPQKTPHYA